MPKRPTDRGLLLVDKPVDVTSHDVVRTARRGLNVRRIGHTGTLDPFASGLLLLCVGPFTRAAELFHPLRKSYAATLRLGEETDTDDHTGLVTGESETWRGLPAGEIESSVHRLRECREQVPSRYSAKKVGGVPAYRRARAGEDVTLKAVPITVHEAEVVGLDLPYVDVEVTVSTGTYVRALARDLGRELGCGAHLTALRRTRIGPFRVEDAATPEGLADGAVPEAAWYVPAAGLEWLPHREVTPAEVADIRHGRRIEALETPAGPVALVADRRLVAIGEADGAEIRPRKVFPA
ncbi:MAG: tRNA pseudouridine(55) synthase TruB [Gemmatimonadota bacterium]|nr:tRNA pseudouridine(55) synthase TruB [Gemmatimonadota bacterium]